jgi:F0F1-type ATP synthase membrane subunit b/b'
MEQIAREQQKAEEETREKIATLAMMAAKKIMEEGNEGVQHQ